MLAEEDTDHGVTA